MPTLRAIFLLLVYVVFQSSSVSQTESPDKLEQGTVYARLS